MGKLQARARDPESLRIAHVFRAPLGGLFRHVVDLAAEQAARGHLVGLFFDSGAMNERVREALARIPGGLALGVGTCPIHRNPGANDLSALLRFTGWLRERRPDVVHGHGSKGGVYARLAPGGGTQGAPIRAYTPHGGSFNYKPGSLVHSLYMQTERALTVATDLFLFESAYVAGRFDKYVGSETRLRRVAPNGLDEAEFAPVAPAADAADLLYVGELRAAKGIDTLLEALPLVARMRGATPRAVLVGTGPDLKPLAEKVERLGLAKHVTFPGPIPGRTAFALGRVLVVPSRAESMPYVVLEAAAAHVPMVATHVGGIPEIFGPLRSRLAPSDDPADLARRIVAMLDAKPETRAREAAELSRFVAGNFTIRAMADAVMSGYREALAKRRAQPAAAPSTVASS